jgi:hypothetical protein
VEAYSAAAVYQLMKVIQASSVFGNWAVNSYSFLLLMTCLSSHSVTWVLHRQFFICARVLPECQVMLWYLYTFRLQNVYCKQWYSRIVIGLVHVVRHCNRNALFLCLFLWKTGLRWGCVGVGTALSLYRAIIAIYVEVQVDAVGCPSFYNLFYKIDQYWIY